MVQKKYSVFKLGDEELAIDASLVTSTAVYDGKKQKLAKVDKFILGKDNSGNVLLDLNLYLNFPLKKLNYTLYTAIGTQTVGFVVNEKSNDTDIDDTAISPTPESILSKYKTHFITGIAQIDDRLIIIIDPSQVFTPEDQSKIMAARSIEPSKGMFGMFGKKQVAAPTPTPQPVAPASVEQQATQTQELKQEVATPQAEPIEKPVEYAEVISPREPQAPLVEDDPTPEVAKKVVEDLKSHTDEISVEDSIVSDDEFNNAIKAAQEKAINNAKENVDKEEEEIKDFFHKLKEDPFLKKQEEVKKNIADIKQTIGKMDDFFEELLTKEKVDKNNYDASEEVLLSSIGIELQKSKEAHGISDESLLSGNKEESEPQESNEDSTEQPQEQNEESSQEEANPNVPNLEEEKNKSCSDEEAFLFNDGRRVHNITEFIEELGVMGDDEFQSHVNNEKNDFANWIRHSLSLEDIANLIWDKVQKQEMIDTLNNYFGV